MAAQQPAAPQQQPPIAPPVAPPVAPPTTPNPSEKPQKPARVLYDCTTLIQFIHHAQSIAETSYGAAAASPSPAAATFGHPDPPSLHVLELPPLASVANHHHGHDDNEDRMMILAVAFTKHCVAAQLLECNRISLDAAAAPPPRGSGSQPPSPQNKQHPPMDLCCLKNALIDDDDPDGLTPEDKNEEVITCLTVVPLEDEYEPIVEHAAPPPPPPTLSSPASAAERGSLKEDHEEEEDDTMSHHSSIHHTLSNHSNSSNRSVVLLDDDDPSNLRSRSLTASSSASSLLRGVVADRQSPSPHKNNHPTAASKRVRLAVVLGTSRSHVFSMELLYQEGEQLHRMMMMMHPTNQQQQQPPNHPHDSSGLLLLQVLPRDTVNASTHSSRHGHATATELHHHNEHAIFRPTGGVTSLSTFALNGSSGSRHVWIAYGNGEVVRMHHAALFPSIWQVGARQGLDLDQVILQQPQQARGRTTTLLRYRVTGDWRQLELNDHEEMAHQWHSEDDGHEPTDESLSTTAWRVVPLPRHHPSVLCPLQHLNLNSAAADTFDNKPVHHLLDALVIPAKQQQQVHGTSNGLLSPASVPAVAFYSSEPQFVPREEFLRQREQQRRRQQQQRFGGSGSSGAQVVLGAVTKALVGSAFGALRWGLGSSAASTSTTTAPPTGPRHNASSAGGDTGSPMEEEEVDREVDSALPASSPPSSPPRSKSSNDQQLFPTSPTAGTGAAAAATSPFPSLWHTPVLLGCAQEFHDAPRQVQDVVVDPAGNYAAATDNLGRVLLFDLGTKQLIRIWKGYREAHCQWVQLHVVAQPPPSDERRSSTHKSKPLLHLVIYSRHRHVVESWRVHQHERVCCVPVSSRDAQMIPCTRTAPAAQQESTTSGCCYLVHSCVPGESHNLLEKIHVGGGTASGSRSSMDDGIASKHQPLRSPSGRVLPAAMQPVSSSTTTTTSAVFSKSSTRAAALRLQHLQQLLSPEVEASTQDVYSALVDIQRIGDLATALDLIASSSGTIVAVSEEEENTNRLAGGGRSRSSKTDGGSEFQKVALAYCHQRLQQARADALVATTNTASSNSSVTTTGAVVVAPNNNPQVLALSKKLQFHSQVVKVFDILFKFETAGATTSVINQKAAPAFWTYEAIGWATTSQQVTGSPLESIAATITAERIQFSKFFSSCVFPKKSEANGVRIYFSDSSRTRRDVLAYVFSPLLGDIFSFNVVYSVFDTLGIRDDADYMLKCFGEWFMLLSSKEITSILAASNPPVIRFLRDLAIRQFENGISSDSGSSRIALDVLHAYCRDSCDLVRAYMLGAVCREAVVKASMQTEKASYGKVVGRKLVEDWQSLLRKLRVCLLVSLRLTKVRLPAPISVANVDRGDTFSVYEWLAHDELSMSHSQEELSLLEKACAISSHRFDPSSPAGDGDSKFKVLHNSCLASQISEEERTEYLVDFDDDDRFGALLLFLGRHNNPSMLAAHRALLLSLEWVRDPKNLDCLHDSYYALDALHNSRNDVVTAAVCQEIWKLCALVFRAHLFGFDDIQEISDDAFAPLLQAPDWLLAFGRIALNFLSILRSLDVDLDAKEKFGTDATDDGTSWPPVRTDIIINRLVRQVFIAETSAVDTHCVVICALLVSPNTEALVECVPAIYHCFLPSALSIPVAESTGATPQQYAFVEEAVTLAAEKCPNHPLDRFNFYEIETLAHVWGIEPGAMRSQFLLVMYELEKDRAVDELLTKSSSQIDVSRFVEHGVDIVCHRLDAYLSGGRMDSSTRRNVMGLLDADVVDWVEQRAAQGQWLAAATHRSDIPIGSTRVLLMRLLSMSAGLQIEAALRTKIHSLGVLSGILAKELTGHVN